MARIPHGGKLTIEKTNEAARKTVAGVLGLGVPVGPGGTPNFNKFGFLFPDLQNDPANLLPEDIQTVANLKRLGGVMQTDGDDPAGDSNVPAAYTYLGQFIDHDITFELVSDNLAKIADVNLAPISLADIEDKLSNTRSGKFDLDSVYEGLGQRDEDTGIMGLGSVTIMPNNQSPPNKRPSGKDDHNDLPRKGPINIPKLDREALIGDPRNDENTIVSQLHLAFLRVHNSVIGQGKDFEAARKLMRQHYQWMVVHDFLKRIAAPAIVDATVAANSHYQPDPYDFFMPLEFAVAAYRFGHSMVRKNYDFNVNFNRSGAPGTFAASLDLLFVFSALSGQLGSKPTLPENWIIEWERLLEVNGTPPQSLARKFDTQLVEPLAELKFFDGTPLPDEARLAVRNLLRGYMLRMPTGQAVAVALGLTALTAAEIEAAVPAAQAQILQETGMSGRTPLWFYILAEASHGGGERLGPVGSTLIAEVMIGLIRHSDDSIFDGSGFTPTLGAVPGAFDLTDLLRLAGVL